MSDQCYFCGGKFSSFNKSQFLEDKSLHKGCIEPFLGLGTTLNDTDRLIKLARSIHNGPCPLCGEQVGGIDHYFFYQITKAFIFYMPTVENHLCCAVCAQKLKWQAIKHIFQKGWLAVGIILAPIYIISNLDKRGTHKETLAKFIAKPKHYIRNDGYLQRSSQISIILREYGAAQSKLQTAMKTNLAGQKTETLTPI